MYKSPAAKVRIMALYDQKLAALGLPTQSLYLSTSAGETHVLQLGDTSLPPLLVFHGINAGAAATLEPVHPLSAHFCLYLVDTIGQATRSAETRLSLQGGAIGRWLVDVMDGLGLPNAHTIGISYGAFLLQKLMQFAPERIRKAVFVVPSGLVNGPVWPSIQRLSLPLLKFHLTKSRKDLASFLLAFHGEESEFWFDLHFELLTGTQMDYRRPPLLTAADVAALQAPVYAIVADNDVFFPGQQALAKCRAIFPNFQESHVLRDCKHMPDVAHYAEIQDKIKGWLAD